MAKRRGVRWLLIALAVVLAVAAVVLYLLNVAPGRYEPLVLDGTQQDQAMHAFVNQVSDFGDKAGAGESFTWSITARQINAYLGAMDAIASLPYDKPQRPSERLLQAGLAAPAVSMREGVVTLMVYSTRLKKVISMDVTPAFDADGAMTLRAGGVRVGMIPVPQGLADKELTRVRGELGRRLRAATQNNPERRLGPVAVSRVGPMLITILDMLDGQYVRAEIVWPVNHHRVRVTKVEIADGALTIHGSPVQPTSGEAATSRRTATRSASRRSRHPAGRAATSESPMTETAEPGEADEPEQADQADQAEDGAAGIIGSGRTSSSHSPSPSRRTPADSALLLLRPLSQTQPAFVPKDFE